MINSKDFSDRLEKVIAFYGETASSFSEKIGVQRSSISHILSGRNKPSLEFVLKVLSEFPEVELYWLLNGKGQFPSSPIAPENKVERKDFQTSYTEMVSSRIQSSTDNSIERIVIFYKDGTFKNFEHL